MIPLKQISKLKAGTKIYHVSNVNIRSYWVIGMHPKSNTILLLGSTNNVKDVVAFYTESSVQQGVFTEDYDLAKELLWQQYLAQGEGLDKVYFNCTKLNQSGSQTNSPVDAGEQLSGSDKGKVQSDIEVQQGSDGKGDGSDDAGTKSDGDRNTSLLTDKGHFI